jgi:hypothetical protein
LARSDFKQLDEVDRNFDAFSKLLDRLLEKHEGRWALMHAGEVVEIFDTVRDAHVAGWQLFADGRFSVQEITAAPVDLGFYSHAAHHWKT